jgi:hypothetical protein
MCNESMVEMSEHGMGILSDWGVTSSDHLNVTGFS